MSWRPPIPYWPARPQASLPLALLRRRRIASAASWRILNAPGGVRDYLDRYGAMYRQVAESAHPRDYDEALLSRIERARRECLPTEARDARLAWRNQYIVELAAIRKQRQG